MSLDQEIAEEPRDYTKWIWGAVLIMFAVMIVLLWRAGRPAPNRSTVYCKHILVKFNAADAADRDRARQLATRLRERILAGEDFDKLARDYSNDETTAGKGGEMRFSRSDKLETSFSDYVWQAPIGQLSDIITTSFGYHLVIVTDRHISAEEEYNLELERRAAEELRAREAAASKPIPAANTSPLQIVPPAGQP